MAETNPNPALGPDRASPEGGAGNQLAQFGAGCFWSVELAFQRVEGVVKTEVGYSQGHLDNPTYKDVCTGETGHAEVVRLHFDPAVCSYSNLLGVFWGKHDPTTVNRQYRSGIYYYDEEQAKLAKESLEAKQKEISAKIVTEILPAKNFYPAEEYHQQYLEKGGAEASSNLPGKDAPIRSGATADTICDVISTEYVKHWKFTTRYMPWCSV